ncbi:MAG: type II toxin-antitoxin system PemK/MazF family toxin [Syntrophomonadaceae bacterium]|nr:type II toxin-antitoxin system PemK/MazF family toxin [Syntrophomonadaceae bacterium]
MLKPGDIVVTLFGYSDLSGAKIRPAFVVSTESYTSETGLVVLAAISSRAIRNRFEISLTDWRKAGLRLPSKVCVGKLMTVNVGLVKKIGSAINQDVNNIERLLREAIM